VRRSIAIVGVSAGFDLTTATGAIADTSHWTNDDGITHTTTQNGQLSLWNSGNITAGNAFTKAIDFAASYPYHCNIHMSMTGGLRAASSTTSSAETDHLEVRDVQAASLGVLVVPISPPQDLVRRDERVVAGAIDLSRLGHEQDLDAEQDPRRDRRAGDRGPVARDCDESPPTLDPELMVDGKPEPVGPVVQRECDQPPEVELHEREMGEMLNPLVGERSARKPSRGEGDAEDRHVNGNEECRNEPSGREQSPEEGFGTEQPSQPVLPGPGCPRASLHLPSVGLVENVPQRHLV